MRNLVRSLPRRRVVVLGTVVEEMDSHTAQHQLALHTAAVVLVDKQLVVDKQRVVAPMTVDAPHIQRAWVDDRMGRRIARSHRWARLDGLGTLAAPSAVGPWQVLQQAGPAHMPERGLDIVEVTKCRISQMARTLRGVRGVGSLFKLFEASTK